MNYIRALAIATSLAATIASPSAFATVIGPGFAPGNELLDTQYPAYPFQGRLNIDNSVTASLGAGSYVANTFRFEYGQSGNVTPFLAYESAPNTFVVLALGGQQTVTGSGSAIVAFGGSNGFSLGATTTVFAGIVNIGGDNPVWLDAGTGPAFVTDHDNNGWAGLAVSSTITGTWSNPDIGRQYNFSIDVVPAPEPASLALLGLGLFALGFSRRKKQIVA